MKASPLALVMLFASACRPPFESAGDDANAAQQGVPSPVRSNKSAMPPLDGATAWLQSEPLTATGLAGKVVLVDFWTYSCINWRRSLPYVRAWSEKYKDFGLVVVGVHSPEFGFEQNVDNVRWAVKDMQIGYPIAIDDDFAIWRAFQNDAWPALYIIDRQGHVRQRHAGEGSYEEQEKLVQLLLAEGGNRDVPHDLVSVDPKGLEVAADWGRLQSPENYLGYERTVGFASLGGAASGQRRSYVAPAQLALNQWALSGEWTMGRESSTLNQSDGRVAYRFHARDLHLVMGTTARGANVRFRALIDGHAPGGAHGTDTDDEGNGTVTEPRLYQLIRQTGPVEDRRFDIEFLDPGAEIFSFTFG